MWLALVGGCVESVCDDSVGEMPKWYDDVTELGWDSVLGVLGYGGFEWPGEMSWGIAHGIAPEQPFLVHHDKTRWYRCSYEYEEYDCDHNWEILRIAPLAPSVVLKRWERDLKSEVSFQKAKRERAERERFLTRTDTKAMFISEQWYWGHGYYDEMSPPSSLRYSLCSSASLEKQPQVYRRHITATLVSAEDVEGRRERAMDNLVQNALKELPGIEEKFIRALPIQGSW